MSLSKWDNRFLAVAKLAASWSKDPNACVGAVVVDTRGQIAGVGYNGFPIRVEDSVERLADKNMKNEMIVHAEENAILGAGTRAKDATIYIVGKPVCGRCAGTIIQARMKRVVAQRPAEGTDSHWDKVGLLALEMFKEANIEFEPVDSVA